MMTFILFVVIFGVVVIAHEFGHFLLAKLNGIHVIEFAVGMGPTLFSVTKGETKYSVKLFPIGGVRRGRRAKREGESLCRRVLQCRRCLEPNRYGGGRTAV